MAIKPELYLHEDDQKALDALKQVPGFPILTKAFLRNWNEKQAHILFMSSAIRVNEKQLPKYYNMLPPICDTLGIPIPELYIIQDVNPNAFTTGDEHPYIALTSGLLKSLPDELIPTVLAHECGHIACKHVFYRTIGATILGGSMLFSLGRMVSYPLQAAFYYWMRCSEYSADRAAALCDGTDEKINELCMRLAGYDKAIQGEMNMEEFRKQGEEYQQYIAESRWNQTMEFLMLQRRSHPFMAVRALECSNWVKTRRFQQLIEKGKNDNVLIF